MGRIRENKNRKRRIIMKRTVKTAKKIMAAVPVNRKEILRCTVTPMFTETEMT